MDEIKFDTSTVTNMNSMFLHTPNLLYGDDKLDIKINDLKNKILLNKQIIKNIKNENEKEKEKILIL